MKYDEDNDWYIIELKKKQGTYEDYYKLYKESENIVKGFADKFTAWLEIVEYFFIYIVKWAYYIYYRRTVYKTY